jgi:signal transduction histidine kinase
MIQQSIEEVRRIQMDLRPSILDDLGILATIGWFCREFQTVYSTIHVEKQISLQESEVSAPLKTVIYRVIQEALNNIAKHSRADRVHLSLSKLDGKIELAIKDNGVGFVLEDVLSIESARRGFGLSGMRERVELSGGAFWIESRKGSGTTVQASWSAG